MIFMYFINWLTLSWWTSALMCGPKDLKVYKVMVDSFNAWNWSSSGKRNQFMKWYMTFLLPFSWSVLYIPVEHCNPLIRAGVSSDKSHSMSILTHLPRQPLRWLTSLKYTRAWTSVTTHKVIYMLPTWQNIIAWAMVATAYKLLRASNLSSWRAHST